MLESFKNRIYNAITGIHLNIPNITSPLNVKKIVAHCKIHPKIFKQGYLHAHVHKNSSSCSVIMCMHIYHGGGIKNKIKK